MKTKIPQRKRNKDMSGESLLEKAVTGMYPQTPKSTMDILREMGK